MRATREPQVLAGVLGMLHLALERHFEREERPGGLYDNLGATQGDFRDQVRDLVDDHFRLLAFVRALAQQAGDGSATPDELEERVAELLRRMRVHEDNEKGLVEVARQAIVLPIGA